MPSGPRLSVSPSVTLRQAVVIPGRTEQPCRRLPGRDAGLEQDNPFGDLAFPEKCLAIWSACAHRPQKRQAVLPAEPLAFFGTLAQVIGIAAVIELMRPYYQRISEVEGVTAPAGVRVFFFAQPQCPVQVAQSPVTDRAKDTGYGLGIVIEDVCKMAMLFGVVEVQHLIGVLNGLGELAHPAVAGASKSVSCDQQVSVTGCRRDVQHFLHPSQGFGDAPLRHDVGEQAPEDREQCVVALERLRQGQGWMQAGPDFWGGPTLQPQPCGAEAGAQLQLTRVSLR